MTRSEIVVLLDSLLTNWIEKAHLDRSGSIVLTRQTIGFRIQSWSGRKEDKMFTSVKEFPLQDLASTVYVRSWVETVFRATAKELERMMRCA